MRLSHPGEILSPSGAHPASPPMRGGGDGVVGDLSYAISALTSTSSGLLFTSPAAASSHGAGQAAFTEGGGAATASSSAAARLLLQQQQRQSRPAKPRPASPLTAGPAFAQLTPPSSGPQTSSGPQAVQYMYYGDNTAAVLSSAADAGALGVRPMRRSSPGFLEKLAKMGQAKVLPECDPYRALPGLQSQQWEAPGGFSDQEQRQLQPQWEAPGGYGQGQREGSALPSDPAAQADSGIGKWPLRGGRSSDPGGPITAAAAANVDGRWGQGPPRKTSWSGGLLAQLEKLGQVKVRPVSAAASLPGGGYHAYGSSSGDGGDGQQFNPSPPQPQQQQQQQQQRGEAGSGAITRGCRATASSRSRPRHLEGPPVGGEAIPPRWPQRKAAGAPPYKRGQPRRGREASCPLSLLGAMG